MGDHESFKIRDASSYDPVVASFDYFTDRYTAPFAKRMVELASINASLRILDVGSGTGVAAMEAARRAGEGATVTGIDLSEGMLKFAKEKAQKSGLTQNIEFRRMDAEALEFKDASFDKVISLYALFHFPSPDRALAEIYRVLRNGGSAVIAVGAGPPIASIKGLLNGLSRLRSIIKNRRGLLLEAPHFLNQLVNKHLPPGRQPEESSLSKKRLESTAAVIKLLESAGFRQIKWSWEGQQSEVETAEEFWELQTTFSSMARKRLSDASPEMIDVIRKEFFEACHLVQKRGGALVYPSGALFFCADKPANL